MLETRKIVKTYVNGEIEIRVLKGIDLLVDDGAFVAIMGRSGAGKSTLMYQMSLLDEPTSGEILIDGREVHTLSEREKMYFRLEKFGYVFQDYALLPELTALENVMLPLLMGDCTEADAKRKATDALTRVGLSQRLQNLPSGLSGGEQQRVSVSRAIAHKPHILFADEPTANLDRISARGVIDIFRELNAAGQTIIMVTHEEEYGKLADKIIRLDDGKIVGMEKNG